MHSSRFSSAFVVAWIVYIIGFAFTIYDGILSLVVHMVIGAVISSICAFICLAFSATLKIPTVAAAWNKMGYWVLLISVGGAGMLIFNGQLGFRINTASPNTGEMIPAIKTPILLLSYFLVVFPFANLPKRSEKNS